MTDRYDPELLLDYVEGELSQERRAAVEALLARDGQLQQLVEGMRRDRAALRDLPRAAAPPRLIEQANLQLERRMLLEPAQDAARQGAARSFRRYRAMVYAAMAAVVLISAGVLFQALMPNGNLWKEASLLREDQTLAMRGTSRQRAAPESTLARDRDGDAVTDADAAASDAKKDIPTRIAQAPPPPPPPEVSPEAPPEVLAKAPAEASREWPMNVAAKSAPAAAPTPVASAAPAPAPATAVAAGNATASAAAQPQARVALKGQAQNQERYFVNLRGGRENLQPASEASNLGLALTRQNQAPPQVANLQLNVRAANPESARRQVLAWATSNQAQVVPAAERQSLVAGVQSGPVQAGRDPESALADRLAADADDGVVRSKIGRGLDRSAGPMSMKAAPVGAATDAASAQAATPRDQAPQRQAEAGVVAGERELVLVLADDQVVELVRHLNTDVSQRAALEPAVTLGDEARMRQLHAVVRNLESQSRLPDQFPTQAPVPSRVDSAGDEMTRAQGADGVARSGSGGSLQPLVEGLGYEAAAGAGNAGATGQGEPWTGSIDWTAVLTQQLPAADGEKYFGANAALDVAADPRVNAKAIVILPVVIVADEAAKAELGQPGQADTRAGEVITSPSPPAASESR
jgi:hypothetical protein